MLPIYLLPIKTFVSLIVKAIRIDINKDGKVSVSEIGNFFTVTLLPIMLQSETIKEQINALMEYAREFGMSKLKKLLRDMIEGQLLPEELSKTEVHIDLILGGIEKIIEGGEDVIEGFQGLLKTKPPVENVAIKKKSVPFKRITKRQKRA